MDRGVQRRTLLATMLGVFVAAWPAVILVAALPEIADDLHTRTSTIAWVISLPMLMSAVSLPTFGRLGDLRGHRKVFIIGLAVCGVFSVLTAFAFDPWILIILRTLSQTAGTATTPTAIALIMDRFPAESRPRALGIWAFVTALSPAAGLVFGAPIVSAMGWRGVFLLQGVLAVAFLPLCLRWLSETPTRSDVGFDVPGSITLAIATGALLLYLDRASSVGWTNPVVLIALAIAPIAGAAFLRIERRAEHPLLMPSILRNRAFAAPSIGEFLASMSSAAVFFSTPLLLNSRLDLEVSKTAMIMLPLPLGMCFGALIGGRVAAAVGERVGVLIGSTLMATSMLIFIEGFTAKSIPVIIVGLIVQGTANGFVRPSVASAGGAALSPEYFGVGMATMRMTTMLGSTAGISIAIAAYSINGYMAVFLTTFTIACLSVFVMTFVRSRPRADASHRQELFEEIETDTALTSIPVGEG